MEIEIREQLPLTNAIPRLCYFSRMGGMEVLCSIVPPEDIFHTSDPMRELDSIFYSEDQVPITGLSSAKPIGIFDTELSEVVAFAMNFHPEEIRDKYRIIPFHSPERTLDMAHADTYMFCNFRKPESR